MPGECPNCHRQFAMETEYCPACGAPMNPDAFRIRQEREKTNGAVLPMRWYKFLIWFSLPVSLLLMGYQLFVTIDALRAFDPALYQPRLAGPAQFSLYLTLAVQGGMLPLLALTEIFLVKKRWAGVKLALTVYLVQAAYAAANGVLLAALALDVTEAVLLTAEAVLMYCLSLVYFKKRRRQFR